jgi:exonuclease III
MKGWKILWRFKLTAATRGGGGGVLIAWKASAQRSGRIKVRTETVKDWAPPRAVVDGVAGGEDGRLLAVDVDWGGHKLVLINVYLPSGAAAAQKDFIYQRLMPLQRDCVRRCRTPLAAGDWNFVADPSVHRLTLDAGGAGLRAAAGRDSAGDFWQSCLGRQLVDVARHHKPDSRSMTQFGHNSAAPKILPLNNEHISSKSGGGDDERITRF